MTTTDLHELSRMSATLQQHEAAAEGNRAAAEHDRAVTLPCQDNDQIQAIMESETGYVAWINIDLAYLGANRNLDSGFSLTPQAFIGQPVGCIHDSAQFTEFVSQLIDGSNASTSVELEIEVGSRSRSYLVAAHKYLKGEAAVFVGIDITDRKLAEQQLRHNALHDELTGLPNRTLFRDRLDHAFDRARRQQQYSFTLLFLDLDGFKVVNDSLGHAAGDQLLKTVACRLESCLRPNDTVARLGGDEFAILLEDATEVNDALQVIERIQKELSPPVNLGGQDVYTTTSIGIALAGPSYEHSGDLLRDADVAMYRAKTSGKACYEVFHTAMRDQVVVRLQWETELRRALEREEFEVYYQPIVSLKSNGITGFEALVRWQHPERGLLLPKDFMPRAEETGLIVTLDQWMLHEACQQMQYWLQQTSEAPSLTISVNISCPYFAHLDLNDHVASILRKTGLPASNLRLEIKERALIGNPESSVATLSRLRRQGIGLSMDDFGTGYSSLSYLHDFPLDTLKIDRSLVQRMWAGDGNLEIIRAVILLMHSLGKEVVIEGVETAQQLLQIKDLQCKYGQGFLFSVPVTSEIAGTLIEQSIEQSAALQNTTMPGQGYTPRNGALSAAR